MNNGALKNINYRHVNHLTLETIIRKRMQQYYGTYDVDFELADDIADCISQQIPDRVLIKKAESISPEEIMNSRTIREAETTRRYAPQLQEPDSSIHPVEIFIVIVALIIIATAYFL